jgi:outer membrane protein insertion porin family
VPDLARKKVTLRVRVVEGPQFRTGPITITGNELLSDEEVRRLVKLKEGDVFNRGALRASVRALADRYSELGRARAEIDPRTTTDVQNLKVDVTIPMVGRPPTSPPAPTRCRPRPR